MTEFPDRLITDLPRRTRSHRFRPFTMVLVPLVAILFQVYLPRFFVYLGYLELPLLVTVYYALMKRQPIASLLFGALVGLAQDSLAQTNPLGMFGIVKTLVGYFAASVSMRFDVDNPLIQLLLGFFFFFFHQFFYWVLSRALLAQQVEFDVHQTFLFGVLNAIVALPLFALLDKIRE